MNQLDPSTDGITKQEHGYSSLFVKWKAHEILRLDKIEAGLELITIEQLIGYEMITDPNLIAERIRLEEIYWKIRVYVVEQEMDFCHDEIRLL